MSDRTKAFVNLYSAIGTLHAYALLDEEAKKLVAGKDISVRFKVKDGPDGVLVFKGGDAAVVPFAPGVKTDVVLYFTSCKNFNDLVDGKGSSVIPLKGFTKLGFLLSKTSAFNVLTTKMAELMRKTEFSDDAEKKLSTLLAFNAMVNAIAQIGNEDVVGKKSAARVPEGITGMNIGTEYGLGLKSQLVDGKIRFTVLDGIQKSRCRMVFDCLDTAKGVIDGKIDAMGCIGVGKIAMSGFIPMVQNINNILNLVPQYLS